MCGVQGVAAGGGLSIVLAADVVVAARSATFTSAYTRIGLSPDGGQSWLLPRIVGFQPALRPVGSWKHRADRKEEPAGSRRSQGTPHIARVPFLW